MKLILLILSQTAFSFFRTLNVRYTAKDNIPMTLTTGAVVKLSWLISAAIGVNSIIEHDWTTAVIYVISGVAGDYLSFKIRIK
jgi:hypothetical protein